MPLLKRVTTDEFISKLKGQGCFQAFSNERKAEAGSGIDAYRSVAERYGYEIAEMVPVRKSKVLNPERMAEAPVAVPYSNNGPWFRKSDFESKDASFSEVMEFVADNIHCENVEPESAPSATAWNILQIAKGDQKTFFVEWMRMQSKRNDAELEKRRIEDDAAFSVAEINKMLEGLSSKRDGAEYGDYRNS